MKTGYFLAPAAAFVFAMGLIAFQPAPVRADDMSKGSGDKMMKDDGDVKMKNESDKMKGEGDSKMKSGY